MNRLQVTTPEALPEETGADAALRPSRLDEFVGQEQVKSSLQIAIDAAKGRRETLDHTLFFGPPGLGKTTLAMLMAREMGVQLRTTSGPVLEKPGDLVGLLTSLGPGDMLFIDEIHRMKPALEEFLYPAMEDYRVDVRIADGPNAQTIPMALERFTLIGATTRFGLLTPPMRARFGLVERLGFYPPDDLQRIVTRSRRDPAGADRRGRRRRDRAAEPRHAARGQPPAPAGARLRAGEGRRPRSPPPSPAAALARLNVDEFGLDDMDARILTDDHREVRRRARRARHRGRGRRRGRRARWRRCTSRTSSSRASSSGRRAAAAPRRSPTAASASTPPAGQATIFDG